MAKCRRLCSKRKWKFRKSLLRCLFIPAGILLALTLQVLRVQSQDNTQPQLDRDAILHHLNAVITWYRDVTSKVKSVGLPSDAIYQENARSLAAQAVQLAFQSARAEADIISAADKAADKTKADANAPAAAPDSSGNKQPNFSQNAARIAAQIDDVQSQLDAVNKQLATAPKNKRKDLLAQRDKLQGLLALNKALQEAMQKMATFVEGTSEGTEGLEGSIEQLARSVPEVLGNSAGKKTVVPPATPTPQGGKPSGLIGQSLALLDEVQAMHQIDQLIEETERMRQTADSIRKPLLATISATIRRARDLANQAQGPGPASPQDSSREFQSLIAKFKELSSASLPLSQELVVLDQSSSNFQEWRKSIVTELQYELRALLTRVIGIGIALGAVFALSEIWRRLTFRYVHDPRRRRQFLLMRRFVMGFLVGVVLLMGFVTEFSSLATFAGFVTAGIAVGLQAILLSIAAYFFVVGRYGIRVGDRISIAGVTGDVIDIGLVRFYLMELAGTGIELYPTGRVIMFSNSVLFQAGTPLFKQIPGTEYAWHEVAVSLSPDSNYKLVQENITSVVESIYEKYRAVIESQLGSTERRLEVQLKSPKPESRLQFTDAAGLEFVVRYPVDIRRAAEIDDNVTRSILDLLANTPDLKSSVAGAPKIRAAIKG
jgi:small-conductance mechanosensitive channel